ncbi:MAG: hypothetical protein GY795_49510 [Desulfobacterales bacterium]|nr:hypothetical protein [Desulfobacterales bacterium]
MEKQIENKTRLIIKALLAGSRLNPVEIAEVISGISGENVNVSYVRNVLYRISDSTKCDLGYFIQKNKHGNSFVYNMVEESLKLTGDKAYDLTLKRKAKHRYTLEQALREYPNLCKYIKPAQPEIEPETEPETKSENKPYPVIKTVGTDDSNKETAKLISFKSFQDTISPDKKMEITFGYSNKFSVSLASSLKTLIGFGFACTLILAMFCLIAYLLFSQVVVIVFVVGLCFLIAGLLWKIKKGTQ